MSLELVGTISSNAKSVGHITGFSTLMAWGTEKFLSLGVQDQVAIAVGAAAVISYLTSAICTVVKTYREGKEKPE